MQICGSSPAIDLQPRLRSTDPPPMANLHTSLALGALTLLLTFGTACGGVMDELNAANAQVGKGKKPEAEGVEAANAPKQGNEWWQSATSITSKEKDPSLVSCRIEGRTQFMRKNDCLARGGRVS